MKTHWVRVALLGEQLLSQRAMKMNDSLLTLERTSLQRFFPTIPHHPLEMRLQVDVSGSSLSAVSALFFFLQSHSHLVCNISANSFSKWKSLHLIRGWNENISVTPEGKKKGREKEKTEDGARKGKIYKAISPEITMIIISTVPSWTPRACYACQK